MTYRRNVMSGNLEKRRTAGAGWICSLCLVGALIVFGTPAYGDFCSDSVALELNSVRDFYKAGGDDVFRLEILFPGVLVLEVADLAPSHFEPRVELVARDCVGLTTQETSHVELSPDRIVVKVHTPGTYFARVSTDGAPRAGYYRIAAGYAEARPIQWINKEPGCQDCAIATSKADEIIEWDEDDISQKAGSPPWKSVEVVVRIGAPGVLEIEGLENGPMVLLTPIHARGGLSGVRAKASFGPAAEILAPVVPGEYTLTWRLSGALQGNGPPHVGFYPVCHLAEPDDHGDSRHCASAIELGSRVTAEIFKTAASDLDYFSFTLDTHATVILETSGTTDTKGRLFDERGALLAVDDDGSDGVNFRIEKTLCPGSYFLRVEGAGASEGPYSLAAALSP